MTVYSNWGGLGRLHQQMDAADSALEFGQAETRTQIQALYRMVHELSLTVGVAMDALSKAGLLDTAAIKASVDAKLADTGATIVACVTCGANVPQSTTKRTPMGVVCANCAA
jgi:hypothetical protein